jgi:hypothetical protein
MSEKVVRAKPAGPEPPTPQPESKLIEYGHGLTDVSCRHGSRWIWWPGPTGRGKWEKVVWASNCCDCSDPPRPFIIPQDREVAK